MKTLAAAALLVAALGSLAPAQEKPSTYDPEGSEICPPARDQADAARVKALAWLVKNQEEDGSWAGVYSLANTGLAVLAILAAEDEPYAGERKEPLLKAVAWLLAQQKDGLFPKQGHTWIHGQGFATLALSEARGETIRTRAKPELDRAALDQAVKDAVARISESQSASGGWWYTRGQPQSHEGSTTVCAVQALASARNFGLAVDEKSLQRGFEYLKKCQNEDGGFDYTLGPGERSMKEGTAGGVATLALMEKFDYSVMTKGFEFLRTCGPDAIAKERFPYYGFFYGCMGMKLFNEEMASFGVATQAWIDSALLTLVDWQDEDGSSPLRKWMKSSTKSAAYSTAFTALIFSIQDGRLSIFTREPVNECQKKAE